MNTMTHVKLQLGLLDFHDVKSQNIQKRFQGRQMIHVWERVRDIKVYSKMYWTQRPWGSSHYMDVYTKYKEKRNYGRICTFQFMKGIEKNEENT